MGTGGISGDRHSSHRSAVRRIVDKSGRLALGCCFCQPAPRDRGRGRLGVCVDGQESSGYRTLPCTRLDFRKHAVSGILGNSILTFFGVFTSKPKNFHSGTGFYRINRLLLLGHRTRVGPPHRVRVNSCYALSPSFLLLSFSFMTDVPFLVLLILALLFYTRSLRLRSYSWMILASIAASAAILTRQFGMCTCSRCFLCMVHCRTGSSGRFPGSRGFGDTDSSLDLAALYGNARAQLGGAIFHVEPMAVHKQDKAHSCGRILAPRDHSSIPGFIFYAPCIGSNSCFSF